MATHQHRLDRYAEWAKLGPLKRDRRGRFARTNRGGPGRPRNLQAKPEPKFLLPGGKIHPFHLIPEEAMALHDNQLLHNTAANIEKLERAKDLWATLIGETLCRDWFGAAWVKLIVADGTIQKVEAHTQRDTR